MLFALAFHLLTPVMNQHPFELRIIIIVLVILTNNTSEMDRNLGSKLYVFALSLAIPGTAKAWPLPWDIYNKKQKWTTIKRETLMAVYHSI